MLLPKVTGMSAERECNFDYHVLSEVFLLLNHK